MGIYEYVRGRLSLKMAVIDANASFIIDAYETSVGMVCRSAALMWVRIDWSRSTTCGSISRATTHELAIINLLRFYGHRLPWQQAIIYCGVNRETANKTG